MLFIVLITIKKPVIDDDFYEMHPAFEGIEEMKEIYLKRLMEKKKSESDEATGQLKSLSID
jgi:hypothetical protein